MRIRVTRPITHYGRYYAAGEVIDDPSSTDQSLCRIYSWEILADSEPAITSLRKADLVEIAESRGLDVEGLTKAEILGVLGE